MNEIANKAAYYARIAQYASDGFSQVYLGAKDVAPTTDNNGNPLIVGALYFNTVSNILFVWNGASWIAIDEDEIYLGGFSVAPTLNNQGLPLISGNLYWNTVSNNLWAHNGTSWIVTNFNEFTNFMLPSATPVDAINLVNGLQYEIAVVGTTNWVAIGASSATVGVRFTKNAVAATGTGTARRTRDLVERFADIINVKDFGAVGDGVADDTAAIQGALTYALTSGKRSVVFLPSGKYRVTNTLTISSIDSGIIGSGNGLPTIITADHSNGPVIKIIGERQYVKYLTISSSASRTSGSSGTGLNTNCGILHCPGTGLSRYVEIKKVAIGGQPSHGLLAVGTTNSSEYSLLNITNNIGHGIVFANGATIGEPSIIAASGLTILSTSNIFDNGGNGIVIGEPTESGNMPVRIDINNCEFGRNATNAATRKSLFQADVFGRQIVFNTCAFTSVSEFTGGIKIGGSGLFLKANRFLDVSKAIFVESYAGFTTQGVTIQEVHVADGTTQLIPAIDINDLAKDVYVDSSNTFSIGALVSKNRNQKNSSKKIFYKVTDQIINNSSTLTGDNSLLFSINKDERKVFRFVIFYQGNVSAGLKLNITRPASSNISFCTPSSTIINLSNTISIQETMGVGGIITAGCDATQIRSIELTGTVVTSGLPGNVQLFWSQNTAHASDLKIYGQSFLEFI